MYPCLKSALNFGMRTMVCRKHIFMLSLMLVTASRLCAQLFYNNGADIAVTPQGILYIGGAAENAGGLLSNGGSTTIMGFFRNGSTATGGDTNGIYNVAGDWENNNNFISNQSTVNLTGGTQQITGSQVTSFYNLNLLTFGAQKVQTLDAIVTNSLNLNDCELATDDNNMFVLNTFTGAIARNSGFVSSVGPGRLVRNAASTGAYLFPTGWNNNGNVYYRPAELAPTTSDPQSFAVRMAFDNPTLEGYPTTVHSQYITDVNQVYFHLIKQFNSTAPAALTLFYDETVDGTWNSIGRWQNVPEWEDLENTQYTEGQPLSRRTKMDWFDNGQEPHALINSHQDSTLYNWPNVFAPGVADPGNNNSTFHVINETDKVVVERLKIFDRWGEVVYDSERDGSTCMTGTSGTTPTYCWDGYYRGKLQPMGNYLFQASVKIKSTGAVQNASGNIALLW